MKSYFFSLVFHLRSAQNGAVPVGYSWSIGSLPVVATPDELNAYIKKIVSAALDEFNAGAECKADFVQVLSCNPL